MKKSEFEQERNLLIRKHDYKAAVFNRLNELIDNNESIMFDLEELVNKYTSENLMHIEKSGHISFKWVKE